MHIPDGFISLEVAIATSLTTTGFITISLNKTSDHIGLKQAPIMALTTAFIFAAQMINFPVAGGTSGHLLGATLAVIILGNPWAATLSIATVLLIQSLLFADGGITALGANIFNMAINKNPTKIIRRKSKTLTFSRRNGSRYQYSNRSDRL
jgi:cobalt/nickel transport system permease protein